MQVLVQLEQYMISYNVTNSICTVTVDIYILKKIFYTWKGLQTLLLLTKIWINYEQYYRLLQPAPHGDPDHPEEASKDDEEDEKVEGEHVETEILHKVEIKVIDSEVVEVAILDEQLQPEDSLLKALPSHVSPHSGKSGQIFSGGKMQ